VLIETGLPASRIRLHADLLWRRWRHTLRCLLWNLASSLEEQIQVALTKRPHERQVALPDLLGRVVGVFVRCLSVPSMTR
jgi:hypothetical protein